MKPLKNRRLNRLKGFDYKYNTLYFVTSCVKNKVCDFGQIINGEMHLSEEGKIVEEQWNWMIQHYPLANSYGFVVMPDHVHGILGIINPKLENEYQITKVGKSILRTESKEDEDEDENEDINVNTGEYLKENTLPKIKSLSQLMGAFKTTSSKRIHLLGNGAFAWQRSFHERIITTTISLDNIQRYITDNPKNWKAKELQKCKARITFE
ncbi:MAG: transposase [Bacteroidia bacterium]|nr:transposase [Bacteroidia bacterium]MCF8426444.1 transposase [Bacteroidia bacterium]MCF8446191.1 transposase [Bacteroidia bacterium]